jgi:hypothetical protein
LNPATCFGDKFQHSGEVIKQEYKIPTKQYVRTTWEGAGWVQICVKLIILLRAYFGVCK